MFSNFTWLFSSKLINNILQVLFTIASARLLTPNEFGVYSVIIITVNISMIFIELGCIQAIVQNAEITPNNLAWTNLFTIGLSIFISLSILIYLQLSKNANKDIYSLSCLILIFYAVGITSQASLIKAGKFREISVIDSTSYFISFILIGGGLLLLNTGILSIIIAQLIDTSIKSILYIKIDNQKKYFSRRPIFNEKIFKFGLKFSLIRIVNQFTLKGGQILLSLTAPKAELGLYNRAEALSFIPVSLLGHTLNTVLFSYLSNNKNSPDAHKLVANKSLEIIISLIIPGTVFLILYTKTIILILFGSNWIQMTLVFQILIASLPFRILSKINESQLTSLGLLRKFFKLQVMYLLLNTVTILLGFFYLGATGVALGTTISTVIYSIFLAYKNTQILENLQAIISAIWISIFSILIISMSKYSMSNNLISIQILTIIALIFIQLKYHRKYLKNDHNKK